MHTRIQQNGHRRTRSHQEGLVKRHHRKEAMGEEMQTGRRWFVACSVSGYGFKSSQCSSIFRFPELVKRITWTCASHSEAVWRTIRSNWPVGHEFDQQEREMELTPLLAQVGKCRQMFSESFEKESHPFTSFVSQNIQGTHSHTDFHPACFYQA